MKTKLLTIIFILVSFVSKSQFDYEYLDAGYDNAVNYDYLGYSVGFYGVNLVAGVPGKDIFGSSSGAVYIYSSDDTINWYYDSMIYPSDGASGDQFGYSVAIYEDFLIIGAPFDDDMATDAGSVYIYKQNGSSWQFFQKLTPTTTENANFGTSVKIHSNALIVGAPQDTGIDANTGCAYIYNYDGSTWTLTQKIYADDGSSGDKFGISVSIFENYAIAGAKGADYNASSDGAAYIFELSSGTWSQISKLGNSSGNNYDYMGTSVDINNNFAVVGLPGDDDYGGNGGSAFVYKNNSGTWTYTQQVAGSNITNYCKAGYSVTLYDSTIAIGTNYANEGFVHIFKYNPSTGLWEETNYYDSNKGYYGMSVSSGSGFLAVGNPYSEYNAVDDGEIFLYGPCRTVTITSQPVTDSSACGSSYAYFTVDAVNAITYHWQYEYNGNFYNANEGTMYTGVETTVFGVNTGYPATNYRCEITDLCGNTYHTDTVTFFWETEPPVIEAEDTVIVYLDDNGEADLNPETAIDTAYDNCEITDTTYSGTTHYTCADVNDTFTVTIRVEDARYHTASDNVTVIVKDTTPPSLLLYHPTFYIHYDGSPTPIDPASVLHVTDNCEIADTVLSQEYITCSDWPSVVLTVTVTDVNGNVTQDTTTVYVVNSQLPAASPNGLQYLYLDSNGIVNVTFESIDYTIHDPCDVVDSSISPAYFDCSNLGVDTVIISATDMTGNFYESHIAVHIEDTIAPHATLHPTVLHLNSSGNAVLYPGMIIDSLWDNCSIDTVTLDQNVFDCNDLGNNIVTLTVTDIYGNIYSDTVTIVVVDDLPPIIQCVSDINDTADVSGYYTVQGNEYDPVNAEDNCSYTLTNSYNSSSTLDGAQFPVGTTLITWYITDASGNSDSCTSTITITEFVNNHNPYSSEISLYPNPAKNKIYISGITGEAKVTINDITGKQIKMLILQNTSDIDLSGLSSGIYFIKIYNRNTSHIFKVVKQ